VDRRQGPRRDGVPGHLLIDKAEAEVVRTLCRWLIDGCMTVRQILKRLATVAAALRPAAPDALRPPSAGR
jgi:hypothetical protein